MKPTMKRVLSLTLAMLMCLGVVPEMAKMPWPLLLPQAQAEETAERRVPSWAYELPQEPLGDERSSGEWRYALRAGDGYAVITGYDGNSANLAAPAKLDGYDVVGIADGAFSHAVAEITLHGNILYMGDSAFGDAQPVIRALNGSYALLWADSHGLPWQNVSTGVFMPDVVDFSDAPSGRVRRRGDAYVQLGQLEAQRVRTGSFIWLTDARGIVFYYRITALTPQGETVLAAVEVPEVGDVVRELSLTQTIDFTDGEFIPAEGAVMIDSPAGTKDRSTSSEPMDGWTVDLSGGFEKALGKKGSDELECRLVASASGTARYTVEVHNGVLTYYETTENEVVNVDASIATRYGVQGDVWNKAFLSKELPLGDVIIMTGFASVTIEINVVLEFEALFSVKYTTVSSTTKNYDFNKEDWVITDRYATVKPGDNCTFDAAATVRVYVEIEATVAVFAIVKILEISFSLGGEAAYSASTARAFPCELLELRVFARVSISAGVWVGENSVGAKANLLNADLLPKDWLVLRFHLHTVEPVFHRAEDCPFNSVCTVKFEPRNGQKIPSIEVYSGLPIGNNQVPEIKENEYTGKFLGWCTESTGEGVNWEIGSIDGDIVMNDMTLYGIWEKTVPVEFISYADKTPDVQHIPVGGKAVEPAAPQREGYTFLYWYVQEDGEDRRWYFRDYVVPEEGLTLLAKWRNDETGEEVDGDGTTSVMTIGSGASVSTWQDTAEYFKYSIFTVDGKPEGINLTGLTGLATHVRVPSRMTVDVDPSAEVDLESLKVYSISGGIFQGNTNLEAVDFAYQGQISSQSYMFSGCTNLRFVDLRGISMTSVANSMFRGCTSLEKVILPPGIKTIGSSAFYGCASLDSVKLPMGISEVGNYAFSGCTNITKVTLSDSLKSIGVYAFQSCKNLRVLDLGDGVTSIGNHAFVDCVSLEEIYLPDSYASHNGTTSYGPFTGCISVRKLSIGSSNGIIYPYDVNMDSECLEEVIVRGSVHTIAYGCFSSSGEIKTGNVRVVLEEGIEVIAAKAFNDCAGITEVVLPSTLVEIGAEAFQFCCGIQKITSDAALHLERIGNYAFNGCTGITKVTLADSLKSIGVYAFQNCRSLKTLDLGDGVTSIGNHAFKDCVSLEEIYLPDSYVSYDGTTTYGPFTGCTSVRKLSIGSSNGILYPYDVNMDSECLEEVTIRGSVHTIAYGCFSSSGEIRTGNVRVVIEEGVEVIGVKAFNGCAGITEVVLPSTLREIGSEAFSSCGMIKRINLSDTTSLQIIGNYAFYKCAGITDVTLADTVMSIGVYAFQGCKNLKTLDLGDGVTSIGNHAFKDCVSLEEIYLPDSYVSKNGTTTYGPFTGCLAVRKLSIGCSNGVIYPYDVNMDSECLEEVIVRGSVQTISNGCFANAGEIRTGNARVVLEEGVKTISTDAFNGCAGITEVVLPSTLREIGTEAFYACTKIKRINLGDATSLQKIGNYAFYKCAGITDVTLADTVMSIGVYAFNNCTGLKTLDLGDGVMTVGNHAFRDCISLEEIYLPDSYASYNGTTTYGPFTGCKSVRKLSIGSSNGIIYPYDVNIDSIRLEEIVIRGSVRTIGYGSFDNAGEARTGSVRLILEEGVQVIEGNAFRGCTGIAEVVLPSTLKTIGNNAFYGCSGLRTLRISASTTVAGNAFPKKEGMQVHIVGLSDVPEETGRAMTDYFASLGGNVVDAVQPYTLAVSANGGAFEDDVVEIRIQYGWLTVIDAMPQPTNGEHIFSGWFTDEACTQRFTAQTMPARDVTLYAGWDVDVHTVTLNLMGGSLDHALVFPAAAGTNPVAQLTPEMAERSFTGWYLDRYAELPFDGVMPSKDVTLYAGYVKTGLNGEYVIENGAATLVAYHLVEHESTTVYLPETVEGVPLTRIADGAFDGTAVRVLHLPANLESVSPAAFAGMAKLSAIHVREANTAFKAVNGVLYSADGTVLVCYPAMHGMNGVVPAGVKEVAPYAFADARLISVTLPEGLEKIGTCAFAGTQLKEVSLPESLRVLGDRAFSGCRELLLVLLGNGLETLGTGVFANTSGMLAVFGPVLNAEGTAPSAAAVWAEENHLLYNYYALKLVAKATFTQRVQAGKPMELPVAAEVGENLYFTGWYADAQCSGDAVAADAVMPKADTTLYAGSRAVFTCETMTDEDGAATLTLTGWDARSGQTEVTIPASIGGVPVTAVAGGCFTQEAESITVPPTVTVLADGWVPEGWQGQIIAPAGSAAALYAEAAGLSCAEQRWQLTLEVNGGAALPAISAQAGELLLLPVPLRTGCEFAGWYADKALTEAAALTEEGFFAMPGEPATLYAAWTVTDAAAAQLTFTYEETEEGIVVTGLAAGAKTLEIPETLHGLPVVGMSERAFAMQTALTTVKLPGSIGKVPDGAFMGCTALTQAELGEGITELGAECFMHCVSLTSLTLPESLERLGSCALEGTALTTLHLPGGVSWIASDALSGCNQLASVTAAEDNSFYMSVDGVLYDLLDDKLVKYPAARPGTEYTVMDGTCVIGSHAFSGAPLERITLPESVWALESGAFAGCRSLRALPEMTSAYLNSIPADAFTGCYALREITIPETITAIGDGAFAMCPALVKAAVPESVTKIGLQAFGAGVTIEGRTGSFAETYAADNRLLFIDPECTILPESLVISADALTLARGETARLTAAILPENATLSGIRWFSSDSSVVAVSADGEVRALAAGTAQVQAVTANGLTDVCTVTVSGDILVDTLILDADAVTLTETMQHQMVWSILPENASLTTLSWTSADESVCTVDENGLVTALNAGSTTLTATAPGGVSASCTVTVLRRVQEIRLMAEATTVTTGEALSLTWEVLPADAADQTITWRVEPAEYAQCVDGVVTFSRSGYYTVTATAADMNLVSASILVECLADTVWQLPEALCGIEEEAFLGATAEHIVLGGSVVTIGPRAFADCPSLYRIDVPDSVTTIDDSVFEGTSVTIVCPPGSYAQQWAEEHGFPWIIAAE